MPTVSADPLKQKIPVSLNVSLTKDFVIDRSWMLTDLKCYLMWKIPPLKEIWPLSLLKVCTLI